MWLKHFECEHRTEELRVQLLKNPYFDIAQAFHTIDVNNNGFITREDVGTALKNNGANLNQLELICLFSKFNRQVNDDKVSYAEVRNFYFNRFSLLRKLHQELQLTNFDVRLFNYLNTYKFHIK